MEFDIGAVSGLGEYELVEEKDEERERKLYKVGGRAFLVVNKHTLEMRCDARLMKLLVEKYESVMESRYFGKGGIEMVDSGQLTREEIDDLVRLSYNLTAGKEE